MNTPNLRTLTVGPDKAKDFRDTKVLDGQAGGDTAAQKAKNETRQYTTGKTKGTGNPGGENSGS